MLRTAEFWEKESEATLLNLDFNFTRSRYGTPELLASPPPTAVALNELVATWPGLVGANAEGGDGGAPHDPSKEYDRIFVLDAERTFKSPQNRGDLVAILDSLSKQFGDYHQGLSYVTSFLLLNLPRPTVRAIIVRLNADEKYTPNYWCAEAAKFATDAHAFAAMLKVRDAELTAHFLKHTLMPDTYAQKWFVALCVHVLPFEALYPFMDQYLKEGHTLFFKFGLALMAALRGRLLASSNPGEMFALLRLDPTQFKDDLVSFSLDVVAKAKLVSLEGFDIKAMREEAWEGIVRPRIEKARAKMNKPDSDSESFNFSDEEDSDEDSEVKDAAAKLEKTKL